MPTAADHRCAVRVAYVLGTFPKLSETFVSSEVAQIASTGTPVAVFADSTERGVEAPVVVTLAARRPAFREVFAALPLLPFAWRISNSLVEFVLSWWFAVRLAGPVRRFGPDVLHAHFASRPTATALILGRWLDRPVTAMFHANDYLLGNTPRSLSRRVAALAQVFAISEHGRRDIAVRSGCSTDVIEIVRASVHPDLLVRPPSTRQPGRAQQIVSVARLVPKKGHQHLIRGFAAMPDAGDVRLTIIGDGPELARLQKLARDLRVAERVTFTGALPHAAALDLLRDADVAALPAVVDPSGDADGIPVFLMEADVAQVPIVTTAVGGVGELVTDGVSGWLLADVEPHTVATALTAALGPDGAARAARTRVRAETEFDPARQANRLMALWRVASGSSCASDEARPSMDR